MLVRCKANVDEGWTWEGSSSGSYVVKEGYAFFKQTSWTPDRNFDDWVESVWDVSDPLKVKEFTWKLILRGIPKLENLLKRNILSVDCDYS